MNIYIYLDIKSISILFEFESIRIIIDIPKYFFSAVSYALLHLSNSYYISKIL